MNINEEHDAKVEAEIDRKGNMLRNLAKAQAKQARPRRELTREELEKMTPVERLANRGKVLADDLGRTRDYDAAVEQSAQHGLISALEMLIGRKIQLGPALPVLDPEVVDDMQIETRPGERLRLYEPAFDIEALNVLPEQHALPETTQARMELDVADLFKELAAGSHVAALTEGAEKERPSSLMIENVVALDEAARTTIRQQTTMLATQLRAHGAGVDDVKAFSDELEKAWTDMAGQGFPVDEEVPYEACERALNALSPEQGDRLGPALEACSNGRLAVNTVGRDQLLGALADAGVSEATCAQFSAALPQGRQQFNLTAICDAIGSIQSDENRSELRSAFNAAMKNPAETRLDNLLWSGSSPTVESTQAVSQGSARRV